MFRFETSTPETGAFCDRTVPESYGGGDFSRHKNVAVSLARDCRRRYGEGVRIAYAAMLLASTACVTGAGTAAKPTALELQLLGAYEELDETLASAASVRAGNDPTAASFSRLQALALEARASQRFNAGDIEELKGEGCIAETLDAKVAVQPCDATSSANVQRRLSRIIAEENRARADLITWAAYEIARQNGRPKPSAEELDQLGRLYRRLLYESAGDGHLVEETPGQFVRRVK